MTRQQFLILWTKELRSNPDVRGRCFYCGIHFGNPSGDWRFKRTKDHVIPKSKMYAARHNLVDACGLCNRDKGSLWLQAFKKLRGTFYCETVLGVSIPADISKDGTKECLLFFEDLIDSAVEEAKISTHRRFFGYERLGLKLKKIVEDAKNASTERQTNRRGSKGPSGHRS